MFFRNSGVQSCSPDEAQRTPGTPIGAQLPAYQRVARILSGALPSSVQQLDSPSH